MSSESFIDKVLIVMVVYRTSIRECDTWQSLEAEAIVVENKITVLIYDNSPSPQSIPEVFWIHPYYFHQPMNAGVSAAYNYGYRLARTLGKTWLMLLDQDTQMGKGSFLKYEEALTLNPAQSLFVPVVQDRRGILSPFLFQFGGGKRISAIPLVRLSLQKYKAINCGMMVSSKLYEDAGGYEESIPLDFSDIVFLEKVSRITDTLVVVDCQFQHHFSGSTKRSLPDSLERFTQYCRGAKAYQQLSGGNFLLGVRVLFRASKLSLLHFDTRFLIICFQSWLR